MCGCHCAVTVLSLCWVQRVHDVVVTVLLLCWVQRVHDVVVTVLSLCCHCAVTVLGTGGP